MEIDRAYRYRGHRGITYDVIEFTVRAEDCCWLNTLHVPAAGAHQYQVVSKVKDLYERMQAGDRPCVMSVSVSLPLTRVQADQLNAQRWTVASVVSGSVAGAVSFGVGPLAGVLTKAGLMPLISSRLPTFHAGDVMVGLEASVHGGIGPQRSTTGFFLDGRS